jgi:effector-binding domain-containing protein
MKFIKWFFIILIGLAALILLVALFLPKTLDVREETSINLPVNKVYYSLATFSDRTSWDPWMSQDTSTLVQFEFVEGNIGNKFTWTSKKMGSGSMVIDSVMKDQYIGMTLSFTDMNSTAKVWHDLSSLDGGTHLSWGFQQEASYPVGRIVSVIMKNMIRSDYQKGLSNLKAYLETHGVKMSQLSEIRTEVVTPFYALTVEGKGTMDEMSRSMSELFKVVMESVEKQGLTIDGIPFNHYIYYDQATGLSTFEVGFPVTGPGKSMDGIKAIKVEGFQALEAIHTGPYTEFGDSYEKFMRYITENKVPVRMTSWEFYLTDPTMEPDETKWKTLIAFPIREEVKGPK